MSSSYKGLFKVGQKVTRPSHIQVEDTGGNSLPLPVDDYQGREVEPAWQLLPWEADYSPGS